MPPTALCVQLRLVGYYNVGAEVIMTTDVAIPGECVTTHGEVLAAWRAARRTGYGGLAGAVLHPSAHGVALLGVGLVN